LVDSFFQQRYNLGLAAFNGVTAFAAAMVVTKFRRRMMYLTCTISLLTVYIAWTIASERAVHSVKVNHDHPNEAPGIAVMIFIYLYAPAYNIGCTSF